MGFVFDQAAANTISKELYTPKDIETLCFESPLVGMMPKWTEGGGIQYVGAINNALLTSVSSQDTIAFTTGSPSVYQRWQCSWKQNYASANISGMAIDMTRTDKGAMVDAITREMDNGYKALGCALGRTIYGTGTGVIGTVNGVAATTTNVTGDTIKLSNTSQAIQFQVGQVVNSGTVAGNVATPRSGSVTLVAVDLIAGILVANVAWATGISGFNVTDSLFNQGDANNYFPGMAGWLPNAANRPTATDSFNGVNRYSDPVRLAGVYYSGNSAPMEETLTNAVILTVKFGGKPTKCFLNPQDYANLIKGLTGRVQYVTETAFENAQIGFAGVKISTPGGEITLIQDSYCPQGTAYLLNLDEWVMPSMGPVPKNLTEETTGLIWIPQLTSNAFISQLGYRATSYCAAPGHQCVISF
jgi:hypothetical protein